MANDYTEKLATATAMQRHGGSFVKMLGSALLLADPINVSKLRDAFPEYFEQYRKIAKRNNWYLDE